MDIPLLFSMDSLGITGMVAGGGILAMIIAFWDRVKSYLLKMFSFCIATSEVKISFPSDAGRSLLREILKHYRFGFFVNKNYIIDWVYNEPNNRNFYVTVRDKVNHGQKMTLWRKCVPLYISVEYDKITIIYIRGTFDINKFMVNAANEANQIVGQTIGEYQKKNSHLGPGYFVVRVKGDTYPHAVPKSNSATSEDERNAPTPDNEINEMIKYQLFEPVGWNEDDFRQKNKPDDEGRLVFSGGAIELQADIEKYLKSKQWYLNKGAAWNKGYLIYGPPGTGKTSLIRHVAKTYKLPIYSFDLSSMDNDTLYDKWMQYGCYKNPKIFLIEDIDSVFDGRHNIAEVGIVSKKLTFDCLLNTIDGADDKCNRILFVTTNDVSKVDPALGGTWKTEKRLSCDPDKLELSIRPGRIDRALHMANLSYEGYLSMAKFIMKELFDNSEIEDFAQENWEDKTPAQFKELCVSLAIKKMFE